MGFRWPGAFVLVKLVGWISPQSNLKWPHNWLQLQRCANCDLAPSMDLDVSIFCEADLIVSWPLFASGAVKIFKRKDVKRKDFRKKLKLYNQCCQNVTFFFFSFKGQTKKLHARAGWSWEMPNSWYFCLKIWVLFQLCIYCHFSHWKELFLGNFDRGELVGLNVDLNYHLKRKLIKIVFHRESFPHLWAWNRTGFNESLTCDSIPQKIEYFPSSSSLFREEQDIMWGFSTAWRIWFWPL